MLQENEVNKSKSSKFINTYKILENSEYNILMMQLNMLVQASKFFGFAWTKQSRPGLFAEVFSSPKHMACYSNHIQDCAEQQLQHTTQRKVTPCQCDQMGFG